MKTKKAKTATTKNLMRNEKFIEEVASDLRIINSLHAFLNKKKC
jgi:hypothetical protein